MIVQICYQRNMLDAKRSRLGATQESEVESAAVAPSLLRSQTMAFIEYAMPARQTSLLTRSRIT
jgi:hypothetical protein